MILCVGIVGQANNPLYVETFVEDDDSLKFHFIVHCSLDIIDEKVNGPKVGGSSLIDSYLGLLYPTEDYKVYGYISNTGIKFVVIFDNQDVKEPDVKHFFRLFHSAYVDATSNPFHAVNKKIISGAFSEKVKSIIKSFQISSTML